MKNIKTSKKSTLSNGVNGLIDVDTHFGILSEDGRKVFSGENGYIDLMAVNDFYNLPKQVSVMDWVNSVSWGDAPDTLVGSIVEIEGRVYAKQEGIIFYLTCFGEVLGIQGIKGKVVSDIIRYNKDLLQFLQTAFEEQYLCI